MNYDAFTAFAFELPGKANRFAHKALEVTVFALAFVWFLALYAYHGVQEAVEADTTDDLEVLKAAWAAMTLKELKAMAKESGLQVKGRVAKAYVIELLEQNYLGA